MDLKSEKILIAGAGISGIGAAALLGKAGIAAAIYDGNEELDKDPPFLISFHNTN